MIKGHKRIKVHVFT